MFDGMFDLIFGLSLIGIVISFAVPVIIVVAIVWAVRRSVPARRDPAEEALRDRLARGEIDMAEFTVRLRALRSEQGS